MRILLYYNPPTPKLVFCMYLQLYYQVFIKGISCIYMFRVSTQHIHCLLVDTQVQVKGHIQKCVTETVATSIWVLAKAAVQFLLVYMSSDLYTKW